MIKAFFWSKKWAWWAYGVGLLLISLSYAQVHLSVLFNTWYGEFYNIMQKPKEHTLQEFNAGLERFMVLAAIWIILGAIMTFTASHYGLRWREAITKDYFPRWKRVNVKIEGESQRIQEDPALFAEIVESLGLQTINAIMTLVAFIPVLWVLSRLVDVSAVPYIGKNPVIMIQITLVIVFISALTVIKVLATSFLKHKYVSGTWQRFKRLLDITRQSTLSLLLFRITCFIKRASFTIFSVVILMPLMHIAALVANAARKLCGISKCERLKWILNKTAEIFGRLLASFPQIAGRILVAVLNVLKLAILFAVIALVSFALGNLIYQIPEIDFSITLAVPSDVLIVIDDAAPLNIYLPSVKSILTAKYIPGFLVWVALLVTIGGMATTWFVAQKLPKLEYNNQATEAALRKELVLAEENKAEHSDLTTLVGLFTGVKANYFKLYFHKGYVDLWLNMYNQILIILPYVVMGYSLMAGIAALGAVVQVANAFGEVRSSLAIFINNWKVITRLRSVWMRLHEFEANLDKNQPADDAAV